MVSSAGTTIGTASLCGSTAIGTDLIASAAEVFAVDGSVAGFAKSNAVIDNEPEVWKSSPRLSVVRVNATRSATILTRKSITLVNCIAPFRKFRAQAGTLTFHRLAVFVSIAAGASPGAGARTESLITLVGGKELVAERTWSLNGWVTLGPAGLRAVFGSMSAIRLDLKQVFTALTGYFNLCIIHPYIIPQIEPKYVAVALERIAKMGLEPRLA